MALQLCIWLMHLWCCSNSVGVVPSVTFAATANAFHYLNASVELLDVDPKDGLLNINQIHNKLRLIRKRKPKGIHVISPVSLAGKTPNLRYIYQVAKNTISWWLKMHHIH